MLRTTNVIAAISKALQQNHPVLNTGWPI